MKHRRIPRRRAAAAGAAAVALVAMGITFRTANASEDAAPTPTSKTLSVARAGQLGAALSRQLGADAAGSYYDAKAQSLVVNVTDEAAARTVRAAGGRARVVQHTLAELKSARTALAGGASVPGTSWVTDPVSNQIVVTADRTVRGAALTKLTKAVGELGSKARLRRSEGEFKPLLAGGDALYGGGARCSLGFNVTKGGAPCFLTAGHCTADIGSWSAEQGGAVISRTAASRFPGSDYGLVKYTGDTPHPSEVNLYNGGSQAITRAGDATVGQKVTRSGSTTHVHDGEVTGLDATVNYGDGQVVDGLIQTTVCAEPGDSGGALFAGDTALGLTSGGSGDCSSGGETFFQPVPAALAATGTEIG